MRFSLSKPLCAALSLAGAILSLSQASLQAQDAAPKQPNVLFIAVDDLNHWVGYLGRNMQSKTPNLDRLAAMGTRFTRSYCASPSCNPSRAALMTGLRPSTSGIYDNDDDWRPVIPEEKTLPTTFRKAGYEVLGSGKIYHGGFDRKSEWNEYPAEKKNDPKPTGNDGVGGIKFAPLDCKDEDLSDWQIADYAIEQLGKKHDRPVFIACGLHKPHMPWNVPQKYYDLHPLDKIELPPHIEGDLTDVPPAGVRMAGPNGDHAKMLASGRWKEAVQGYLAAISYTDMNIGRLLDAYEKSPMRDNTIIVFWGDHGWHLGEKEHWRKFALWEESTRAPLLWVVPGLTKPGSVCERTVDFMSLYPTLCDLSGIPVPAHVEGKSIKSLLQNPTAEWATPALTTYKFGNHTVRSEGWRYTRYENGDEELYDETKDPLEHTNLAGDARYAEQKAQLAQWLPKTNQADANGRTGNGGGGKGKKKAASTEAD
ncbi:sulfatase [Verrucomicrobium sp. BvORR106]|uniref:sulfatase n=1 Tax=Verrucomicrobium sp. BvORR106 TaxID=1403819 RepID=UPI002240FC01|nr:sulfatase [Verrucomicrobium sp. BvORR106]